MLLAGDGGGEHGDDGERGRRGGESLASVVDAALVATTDGEGDSGRKGDGG